MRTIDLFAGAGGFTEGATQAGAEVLWCANHWQLAVDTHAANHPEVEHSCQDLQQTDWSAVPACDLLLASPSCRGQSEAGQPGRDGRRFGVRVDNSRAAMEQRATATKARQLADRNTAWAIVNAAEELRPATIIVENVQRFLRWPLLPAWRHALELLGYELAEHVFDAADFGTPQNRVRAVVTARLGERLELTSPLAGMSRAKRKREHRAFGPLIEWDRGRWRPWREVAAQWPGVGTRIRAALARGCGPRFLTHYVTGHKGREFGRPIGCITTKNQWAAVDGDRIRMLSSREKARGQDLPDTYQLPALVSEAGPLIGNAIPVRLATSIVRQAMGGAA